jgi:uncharacterized membrane protein YdjX (TVP38/TMEM64 family)
LGWRRALVAVVLVLAVAGFYALGLHREVSWDALRSHLDLLQEQTHAHPVVAAVVFFLAYGAVAALSLPVASALGLLAGALFGRWLGTGLVDLAATLGATGAFLSSRYLFRDGVQHRFGHRLETVNQGVERDGTYYLLTLRLVPVFPFFLVNLGMGLTPMRVWTFAWVSLLGMLPGTFLYVNAGAELGRMASPRDALSPGLLASLAALGLVPLALRWLTSSYTSPRGGDRFSSRRDGRE